MTPSEFVHRLWNEHGTGKGWGEIWGRNHRTGSTYTKGWIRWPAEIDEIEDLLDSIPDQFDKYVTVPIFRRQKRDFKNAWPTRWVWLDVDHGYTKDYLPSVKVRTGYVTTQAYWRLPEPIPVPEAVAIGRRLQKRCGADPEGSWICKPLRIPGYMNGKEEYQDDPPEVELLFFDPKVMSKLPMKDEDIDHTKKYPKTVTEHWSEPPDKDRSIAAFKMYSALSKAGFSAAHTKLVVCQIPWIREKWSNPAYIEADVDRFYGKEKGARKSDEERTSTEYIPPVPAFGLGGAILSGREKPFLIEDWLREGSWHILHGNPKTYKSAITHHLVIATATGVPAFGKYAVKKPGPVLILDWENTTQTYQTTLWRLATELCPDRFAITAKRGLISIDGGSTIPLYLYNRTYLLSDEGSRDHILHAVETIRPSLIVIDTLMACTPGMNINEVMEWQQLEPFLESLCQWGAALLIIHHNRKSSLDVTTRGHAMAGTNRMLSWAESTIATEKKDDNNFVDLHFTGRFEVSEPLRVTVSSGEVYNNFTVDSIADAEEEAERVQAEKESAIETKVVQAVTQLEVAGEAVIQKHLKKQGHTVSRRQIKKILDNLVDSGMLDESRGAKGRVWTMV